MAERQCPKCGEEGYENTMFMFYSFKCKKCGFVDSNLDKPTILGLDNVTPNQLEGFSIEGE